MSYAGVERVYPKPCSEGTHVYTHIGVCHVCGVKCHSDGYSNNWYEKKKLEKEVEQLRQENERLKKIEKRYNEEHADDRYDPMG